MARKQVATATKEAELSRAEVEALFHDKGMEYLGWGSWITDYYPSGSPELVKLQQQVNFSVTNGVWITFGPETSEVKEVDSDEGKKKVRIFYRKGEYQVREVGAYKPDLDPRRPDNIPSDRRIVEYAALPEKK